MSSTRGGYDYQILHSENLSDDQKCPICFLVVRNAYQLNCCGKLFCESCLMELVNNPQGSCPMCRSIINDRYFLDTRADREIKNLKVLCDHKGNGCSWTGELRNVEEHMATCEYQEVECQECAKRFPKRDREKHMTEDCVMRQTECVHCNEKGTYQYITTTHRRKCPNVLVRCLNSGCNVTYMRFQSVSHSQSCPKAIIKCPFHSMGCGFNSQREALPSHIEKMFKEHLQMVAKTTQAHIDAPVTLKMTKFHEYKTKTLWYSDGFYTGPGGYKVRLKVFPNGGRDHKSTHMSVFVNILPGENDDNLQFPLQGQFTIEMLNQVADANHHSVKITFNSRTPEKNVCRKYSVDGNAHGVRFAELSILEHQVDSNVQYLVNDMIYFRIKAEISSQTKPWLAMTALQ